MGEIIKHYKSWLIALLCVFSFSPLPLWAGQSAMLRIGGSGTDLGTMKLLAETFMAVQQNIKVEILPSLGSSGGVRALLAGRLDIALTSRALKPNEAVQSIRAILYAQTALVFATAADNPTNALTARQLQKIYSGVHPYWPDRRVARPVLRPQSDSDTLLLHKKLPWLNDAMSKAYLRRGIPVAVTDQISADKIAAIPGAIGTGTLALMLAEQRPLKALSIDNMSPDIESINNGKYPLLKDLFVVIANEPSAVVQAFLQHLSSVQSQQLLKQTGHKPIAFSY